VTIPGAWGPLRVFGSPAWQLCGNSGLGMPDTPFTGRGGPDGAACFVSQLEAQNRQPTKIKVNLVPKIVIVRLYAHGIRYDLHVITVGIFPARQQPEQRVLPRLASSLNPVIPPFRFPPGFCCPYKSTSPTLRFAPAKNSADSPLGFFL